MQETILIVGASSGLGRRLSELYCLEGCRIGVVGRRKELLEQLAQSDPHRIVPFHYDIANTDCDKAISQFIRELNGIDKLILTASVVEFNPDLKFSSERQTIETNVYGFTAVLNAAYHYFLAKGSGHIVGVTSIAAARGNKTAPAYNASKAFQSSYLEGLRLKLAQERKNIFVTELVPGYIDTQMAKGNRLFWIASLDKAALQAKSAIDRKKKRAFITKRWRMIYAIYKFLPAPLYTYLINSKLKFRKTH